MSEENVEVVRRLFPEGMDMAAVFADPELLDATRRAFEPIIHSDFETLADPAGVPMADFGFNRDRGIGIEGFITLWRDWLSAWDAWVLGPPEFIDVDVNRVLVFYAVHARSKTHQAEMGIETGSLLTLRGGKVARVELFFNRGNALEAAGLSE